MCEKLNLKPIVFRDVKIKCLGNQVLQEKLDYVRVCLKSTDNENIVIICLVKDICQPQHGQDILHVTQKCKHLKNLKLADSNSNNENLCVDFMTGSDFLWDMYQSEIIWVNRARLFQWKQSLVMFSVDQCQKSKTMKVPP